MALILCHSPTGGVGTTFLAAHLAQGLATRGHQVTAIDFTHADALKLFFGVPPTQAVPSIGDEDGEGVIVEGVELLGGYDAAQNDRFAEALTDPDSPLLHDDRIVIADVASADLATRNVLMPYATLHLCVLAPQPASLAALGKVQPGTPTIDLIATGFVLNLVDDARKLSRHAQAFLRELFGEGLIATVRRDEAVNEAMASFQPVSRYAPQSVVLPDLLALAAAVEARCDLRLHADDTL